MRGDSSAAKADEPCASDRGDGGDRGDPGDPGDEGDRCDRDERGERTRGPRRALVEAEILEEAARLFATRGFAATSMQDIATALGTSRPALYHYFAGKEEILTRLVRGLAEDTRRALAVAAAVRGGAEERLDGLVRALIASIVAAPLRARLIRSSLIDLQDRDRQFAAVRQEVFGAVSDVITAGRESGEFRPCDPVVAAYSVLGLVNWLAWWYNPVLGPAPEALADELVEMAVAMVRAHPADRGLAGVSGVIASMRRDLDFLERTVAADEKVTRT